MYQFDIRRRRPGVTPPRIPTVVYWVGLCSLLADISAEAVASALPIFLFTALQLSPLEVGFLDGLYQGGASIVRVISAYVADKRRSNRAVALLGYAMSAVSRIGFLLSGSLGLLVAMVSLCIDRVGKGIRTAPRDAIIAGHTEPASVSAAFGVHRSMDAVGALVGPLLGAAILWLMPMRFDMLFAVSLGFGVLAVGVFATRVTEPPPEKVLQPDGEPGHGSLSLRAVIKRLLGDAPFMRLVVLTALLSVFTVSDGLVYLTLQREAAIEERYVPLMFALTALMFLLTAAPIGRLADAVGAIPLFVAGYALLAAIYLWLAFLPHQDWRAALVVTALLGVHYAATDGILAAAAVRVLHPSVRTTGLALLTTVLGVTRIGASSLYGGLWQMQSQPMAMMVFAIGMTCCCVAAALYLGLGRRSSLSATTS